MQQELLNKRTYSQKHFLNDDGTITMRAHAGHIHYKDELGLLQDSEIDFSELADRWTMTKHNYQLEVAKDFAAPILMRYTNKYEGANHTITYEPVALAWYRPSDGDVQIFRNQQAVQGVRNGKSIYYTGAFGNGIDFEITLNRSGFTKEIVIPNKPTALPTAPTADHHLVALFKYGGSALKVIREEDRTKWDKVSHMETEGGYELLESDNIHKSFIRPAYAKDAEDRTIKLRVQWRKRGAALYQIKEIPLQKLTQATYPVRLDTTTSYYAGAGDGGILGYQTESSISQAMWDGVRDWNGVTTDVSGLTSYTAAQNSTWGPRHVLLNSANGTQIGRVFLPIDTSGIPDGATITAASLFATMSCGASSHQIGVTQASQASTSQVVQADFDNVSHVDGATRVTITGTSYATYELVFNATGRGWIDKTGFTKLAVRTEYDIDDNYTGVTNNGQNGFTWSEYTGTGSDPYLEVTYSAGNNYTQDLNESVTITDSKQNDITKDFTDTATVTDSTQKDTSKAYSDSFSVTDSIATLAVKLIEIADSITVTDTIRRAITKTIEETTSITDSVKKGLARAWDEVVSIVDSVEALTATYTKRLTESFTVTDTISTLSGFARSFTESLTITDRLYGLLNGVSMSYVDTYSDTVGEYVDQYFNV